MYNKNIIIWVLAVIVFTKCTNKLTKSNEEIIFSYDLMSDDTLSYNVITPNEFILDEEKTVSLDSTLKKLYKYKYIVQEEPYIEYIKYNSFGDNYIGLLRDQIKINNSIITIDSLLYGKTFSYKTNTARTSMLNAVYEFSLLNKSYLCFYFQDMTNPSSMLNTNVLLFDITDVEKPMFLLHDIQASENLRCFADFNSDGKLDFASWRYGNLFEDTLKLYELNVNNEFNLNTDKYLILLDTNNNYYVDKNKSIWFKNTPIQHIIQK